MNIVILKITELLNDADSIITALNEKYPEYDTGSAVDSRIKNNTAFAKFYKGLLSIAYKYKSIDQLIFVIVLEFAFERLKKGSTHRQALYALLYDNGLTDNISFSSTMYHLDKKMRKGDFTEASKELSNLAVIANKIIGGGPEQCREEVTGLSTSGKNKNMSNSGFGGGTMVRLAAA